MPAINEDKFAEIQRHRYSLLFDAKSLPFEGRFRSIEVERYEYLLHLCRYIYMNPVASGLVKKPEDWPFSNYLEWIGCRAGQLVDREFIQEYFGNGNYEEFVLDYEPPDKLGQELKKYYLDA